MVGTTGARDVENEVLGPLADDLAMAAFDLARCCAAGGTIWCCSPAWPSHAHHVAVEFVHPVIMGKRALPAAVVDGPDLVNALRMSCTPGDVLVTIAAAEEPVVVDALRRAPAWGTKTLWIGTGPRPSPGAADHVLWIAEDELEPAYGGGFVLLYHLLWELSQVCFEHPGLMERTEACDGPLCTTCSDEGRLGEVVRLGDDGLARVRTATGPESVDTGLLGELAPGDLILVHAGTAVTILEDSGT